VVAYSKKHNFIPFGEKSEYALKFGDNLAELVENEAALVLLEPELDKG